jgi:hypothetical protein
MGIGTAGPGTTVEDVLSLYNLEAETWAEDALENDLKRLLVANILEQRDQDMIAAVDEAQSLESEEDPYQDSTSDPGPSSVAELELGTGSTPFDVFVDVETSATVEIEVSQDGSTWRPLETIDAGGSDPATELFQFESTYQRARVYAESVSADDLEVLEIVRGD